MEGSAAAEVLARALREDRLAVLVGSGASAATEAANGRKYPGLPTPAQFVERVAEEVGYVKREDSFTAACDAILEWERRAGLEDALLRHYRVADTQEAPPAHKLLSWLPFSLYITSNYDRFIELSLAREKRRPYVLVDNNDVGRLTRHDTPVIKYHGCVMRPESLVAASGDYEHLATSRWLIGQLLAVSLARKSLLVVGHGLGDRDLARLVNDVLAHMHVYAPSITVLREEGHAGKLPGVQYPYEVVGEDLTQFLNRLSHQYRNLQNATRPDLFQESWLSSPFFAQLHHVAALPTETQVIDAFLTHLIDELGARCDVRSVVADARAVMENVLADRPMYGALRIIWESLQRELHDAANPADAETAVNRVRYGRRETVNVFKGAGCHLIQQDQRILLFSQSQRVLQVLRGVPVSTQRTCALFIAECRPKSATLYQEAVAICRELMDTEYRITVCPDVVAVNLITEGKIDQILMGSHALYVSDKNNPQESVHSFVNTCGSLAITDAAVACGVPVNVVGERLKIQQVPLEKRKQHIHPREEENRLQSVVGIWDLDTAQREVMCRNVGYDLVDVRQGVRVCVPDLQVDEAGGRWAVGDPASRRTGQG